MEIKDLAGLSEPLKKLVETIFNGIGKIFESRYIKSIAKAESFKRDLELKDKLKEINEISNVLKDKEIVNVNYNTDSLSLDNKPLLERTYNRLLHQEMERTNNIDNIVIKVIEKLKDEEKVSDDPVNKDWTKRFFNIAQDISDEYMQELWSRILAGEIKQPNSFSLRTLETLKNMTTYEAELFTKVAKLLFIGANNNVCLFKNIDLMAQEDIYYKDILKFMEIGLINNSEQTQLGIDIDKLSIGFFNKNYVFELKFINIQPKYFGINVYIISEIGKDILKLIDDKYSNDNFFKNNIKKIIDNIKNTYIDSVEYKLQKIKSIDLENNIINPIDENENLINDI